MINNLPQELIIEILDFLSLSDLINLKKVNRYFDNLIKQNKWKYVMVKINKNMIDKKIEKIIINNNFANYSLRNCRITYNILKLLENCYSINLNWCVDLDDQGLSYLQNCHTLSLSNCYKITDLGLQYLKYCKILNLSNCYKITDKGLEYLKYCETLDLTGCYKITDKGLEYLQNCNKIDLSNCNISEKMINELRNKGIKVYI